MSNSDLPRRIAQKASNKEEIADEITRNPSAIPLLLEGLGSEKASIKFGCSRVLRLVSEKKPEILYPQMDFFIAMLDAKNTFLRMDAARVVANLAAVDSDGKFETAFEKFFSPIPGPAMIPAANVIGAAAKIALAKPGLTGRITAEILKVEKAKYATTECRNVALGHAIQSLDLFLEQVAEKAPVVRLVKRQLKNTRSATRKKAEGFIKKHGL